MAAGGGGECESTSLTWASKPATNSPRIAAASPSPSGDIRDPYTTAETAAMKCASSAATVRSSPGNALRKLPTTTYVLPALAAGTETFVGAHGRPSPANGGVPRERACQPAFHTNPA